MSVEISNVKIPGFLFDRVKKEADKYDVNLHPTSQDYFSVGGCSQQVTKFDEWLDRFISKQKAEGATFISRFFAKKQRITKQIASDQKTTVKHSNLIVKAAPFAPYQCENGDWQQCPI